MAATPGRTYEDALALLGKLQSNAAYRSAFPSAASSLASTKNDAAIPEMIEWVRRAGYNVNTDFNSTKIIHVAGTKGKGSVCAMVASILNQYTEAAQLNKQADPEPGEKKTIGKVGLYTSPHLISVCERIAINGRPISEELFVKYFFSLWDRLSASAAASGHPDPTSAETKPMYFRYLTIMALHCFLGEGVESIVLECGIGGEYDSTNILPASSTTVTAITRLGIDHVGMLGNTLATIAWHKGGIMKRDVEVYTTHQESEAFQILSERAAEKGAMLEIAHKHSEIWDESVKLGLEGEFQKDNADLAVAIASTHLGKLGVLRARDEMEVRRGTQSLPAPFMRGLTQVRLAGRCETIEENKIMWHLDGAHTVESIKLAAKWFSDKSNQNHPSKKILIFNQQERDVKAMLSELQGTVSFNHVLFCTNTPFSNQKAGDQHVDLSVQNSAAALWTLLEVNRHSTVKVKESIREAVDEVRLISKDCGSTSVLITGSLYLAGGFLTVLEGNKT